MVFPPKDKSVGKYVARSDILILLTQGFNLRYQVVTLLAVSRYGQYTIWPILCSPESAVGHTLRRRVGRGRGELCQVGSLDDMQLLRTHQGIEKWDIAVTRTNICSSAETVLQRPSSRSSISTMTRLLRMRAKSNPTAGPEDQTDSYPGYL